MRSIEKIVDFLMELKNNQKIAFITNGSDSYIVVVQENENQEGDKHQYFPRLNRKDLDFLGTFTWEYQCFEDSEVKIFGIKNIKKHIFHFSRLKVIFYSLPFFYEKHLVLTNLPLSSIVYKKGVSATPAFFMYIYRQIENSLKNE